MLPTGQIQIVKDSRGRSCLSTGLVRGECDDHLIPVGGFDGPLVWESDRYPAKYVTAARARTLRGLSDRDSPAAWALLVAIIGLTFGELFQSGRRRRGRR